MDFIGKILPVDGYRVEIDTEFPMNYQYSLIHLYQPLLGIEAVNFYQTLMVERRIQTEMTTQTHHTLMNYLNLSLDKIYQARLKLEAIGLLKTYKKDKENRTTYTYQLLAPFAPETFFQDIMLTELLYRHIGKQKFTMLKQFYSEDKKVNYGEDITSTFEKVFQTFEPKSVDIIPFTPKRQDRGVPLKQYDFSSIKESLKNKMIDEKLVFTENNERVITQLLQVYDLEMYEMEKALFWALTARNELDIEQLKAACHDLFQSKHNVTDLKLQTKQTKPQQQIEKSEQTLSKEEILIQTFETISPKELLEDFSQGANASSTDMQMVSDIMTQQGLSAPVMNVLIHYVFLQSNKKLTKRYLETIASHWSRAKLTTARQAMAFARNEARKQTRNKRNYQGQQTKGKEIIPDWFKARKSTTQQSNQSNQTKQTSPTTIDQAENGQTKAAEEEMLAILEKYRSKNN